MGLPTIAVPKYQITLLSDGTKLKYRPFLVKEEKLLHMAVESDETSSQIDAMIDVISACIEKDEDYVKSLPVFDIEYLFLRLRAKSVGEKATIGLKPHPCSQNNGELCEKTTEVEINLEEVQVIKNEIFNFF